MKIADDYAVAKQAKQLFERNHIEAAAKLAAIPGVGSGPMGLTPDSVKSTPEFQTAWQAERKAFEALRQFNGAFVKKFRKEIQMERRQRQLGRLKPR